jgi:hypothetical protein
VLIKIAHPKTNIRRTFLEKLCFDFIADSVAIKLRFRQQVAAEALNIFRNSDFAAELTVSNNPSKADQLPRHDRCIGVRYR